MNLIRTSDRTRIVRLFRSVGQAGALLLMGILLTAEAAGAQHVESPVLPRGSLQFEVRATHTQASSVFAEGGEHRPFGLALLEVPLTSLSFPGLEPEEERLRELLENPDARLRLGTLAGRFDADEQHTRLRVGWGATDRFTLGMTVPLVRRQRTAMLGIDPTEGNVGVNPASAGSSAPVGTFRSEAGDALAELRSLVEDLCTDEGDDQPACMDGRATVERIDTFLSQLDAAWDEALLFPLAGSAAGASLDARWAALSTELSTWKVDGPESVPLATRALSADAFGTELGASIWGAGRFPFSGVEPLVELGDVRLHVAGALLTGEERGVEARLRVRSAVEFTARLPTGVPDSLSLIYPMDPQHGHAGGEVRWLTDILLDDRLALLAELEWQTFLDRDITLLAGDPDRPWAPETARREMSGAPGDRLRVRLSPRWILVPGLSIGAGWELLRSAEARWTPTDPEGASNGVSRPFATRQRASVEFRFAGWDPRFAEQLPFPVELMARASWSVAGTDGAPRDRQLAIGARVLRGAR